MSDRSSTKEVQVAEVKHSLRPSASRREKKACLPVKTPLHPVSTWVMQALTIKDISIQFPASRPAPIPSADYRQVAPHPSPFSGTRRCRPHRPPNNPKKALTNNRKQPKTPDSSRAHPWLPCRGRRSGCCSSTRLAKGHPQGISGPFGAIGSTSDKEAGTETATATSPSSVLILLRAHATLASGGLRRDWPRSRTTVPSGSVTPSHRNKDPRLRPQGKTKNGRVF